MWKNTKKGFGETMGKERWQNCVRRFMFFLCLFGIGDGFSWFLFYWYGEYSTLKKYVEIIFCYKFTKRKHIKYMMTHDKICNSTKMVFIWVDIEQQHFITKFSSISPGVPCSKTRWRWVDSKSNSSADRINFNVQNPEAAE